MEISMASNKLPVTTLSNTVHSSMTQVAAIWSLHFGTELHENELWEFVIMSNKTENAIQSQNDQQIDMRAKCLLTYKN